MIIGNEVDVVLNGIHTGGLGGDSVVIRVVFGWKQSWGRVVVSQGTKSIREVGLKVKVSGIGFILLLDHRLSLDVKAREGEICGCLLGIIPGLLVSDAVIQDGGVPVLIHGDGNVGKGLPFLVGVGPSWHSGEAIHKV